MAETNENTTPEAEEEVPQEEQVDLIELMDMRARTYGMLARLYRKEVDEDALKELQGMRFPVATGNEKVDEGYKLMYEYLRTAWDDSITELAIDYVRTFIGHGVNAYSAAYPYESVYTSERRLMMQEARGEVLKSFRQNHLKKGKWNDAEDHIALELEFMQRMAMRTASSLREGDEDTAIEYLDTQHTFAQDHLLNWLPMMTSDMHMFSQTKFYNGLASLTMGYIEEDEALLGELLDSVEEAEEAEAAAAEAEARAEAEESED